MKLVLNAEKYVNNYQISVDSGEPATITPAADGSATFDLSGCDPGSHTVTAVAVNATGSSAAATWTFTVDDPIPAVPTGEITE
jgi:hypothetical protein